MGPNHHGHARSRFPALLALLAAAFAPLLASCASNPRLEVLAPAQAPPGGSMAGDPPWTMHVIDNPNFRLPNGLDSADADGDGMLEMIGALIHHAGKLPSTKAAVFWMDVDWKDPAAPALGHVVKWGSDFPGTGPLNGEKWDRAVLDDIDGDGDLDIAANCEEFDSPFKVHLAVVWFENPLR
ncbi:MAG: hypothetical protein NT005_04855 [Spirochaetes bacterium]|nr:hypothetical protein [Spirochaetota bacterium]